MRATILLATLALLTAPAVAADHGPAPGYPTPPDRIPCPALPLWDNVMCEADRAVEDNLRVAGWAIDVAVWTDHLVRCDVVGGPPCTLLTIGGPDETD